jgi:OOP family OmpA-OmpF porin
VRRFRLTNTAKAFSALVVTGVVCLTFYTNPWLLRKVAPSASNAQHSNVPSVAALPGERDSEGAGGSFPLVTEGAAGCADKPEVRFYHWAWNAQMGMMLATGGKQAQKDSLMCKHGVNLVLVREDNTDQMQNQLVTFAEGVKKGESNPKNGAHFVAIMGDGSAQFLKGVSPARSRVLDEARGVAQTPVRDRGSLSSTTAVVPRQAAGR